MILTVVAIVIVMVMVVICFGVLFMPTHPFENKTKSIGVSCMSQDGGLIIKLCGIKTDCIHGLALSCVNLAIHSNRVYKKNYVLYTTMDRDVLKEIDYIVHKYSSDGKISMYFNKFYLDDEIIIILQDINHPKDQRILRYNKNNLIKG